MLEVRCQWIKPDGTNCRESKLVPDAHYCYRHYWQALWLKTQLTNSPLPTKVDWEGLFYYLIPLIFFLIGNAKSSDWVLPYWLDICREVLQTPYLIQSDPSIGIFLVGWFAVGANIGIWYLLWSLFFCYYPLRPKIRRLYIQIALTLLFLFTLLLVGSLVASIITKTNVRTTWILTSLSGIISYPLLFIFFKSADNLKPDIIKTGVRFVPFWVLSILVSTTIYVFWFRDWEQGELLFVRLINASFGIGIGYLFLTQNGRSKLIRWAYNEVAKLADALHPADAYLLGFTSTTPDVRRRALAKAFELYSNLTPLEQEELEEYILIKHRPSTFQILMGIISIILSAFLLEAPAQQAFVWLTCSFLKLGAPLCY